MIRSLPPRIVAFGAQRARRRVTAIAVAVTMCAAPLSAVAVSFDAITQQSALGRPLRVVIPVTLGEGEELPAECFRLASGPASADGVPELLFGRISVERAASGTTLVVTSPRPVNDPVVRITIQAGCETSVRREYTLFMDPPAIDAPIVTAETSPPEVPGAQAPAPRETRRPPRPQAQPRTTARSAQAQPSSADAEAQGKAAPAKGRAAARAAPKPPPATTTGARPRLSVSSGAPGTLSGSLSTEADRERARQERANTIEAETAVLRQRIVELSAMVEQMQQELRVQEAAERAQAAKAPADAAKAPEANALSTPASAPGDAKPPAQEGASASEATKTPAAATKAEATASVPSWWEQNAWLIAAIVGLPILIAAFLLRKRRHDAMQDELWRMHTTSIRPGTPTRASSQLRNTAAGLVMPDRRTVAPGMSQDMETLAAARDAVDALAVSELSHVTEEARVFVALGHNDRAIDVLQDHIGRLPRSMPAAWIMLLDLYHRQDNRSEFRKLAESFHTHFNVRTPLWEEFAAESVVTGGIDSFPIVEQQIVKLWRQPSCRTYLETLLYDNREGRRNGFPLATYSDILMLLQVIDSPPEVDIDEDLVAAGKLERRPKAKPAAQVSGRTPMPPGPASSRPAQQPIRFEVEPDTSERKP